MILKAADCIIIFIIFSIVNVFVALSCIDCWKISVIIVSISGIYCCWVFRAENRNNRIHLRAIIPTETIIELPEPDFSRFYRVHVLSPLHRASFECSICLESSRMNKKTLLCGHSFHQDCIERWFVNEETCPLCRSEF